MNLSSELQPNKCLKMDVPLLQPATPSLQSYNNVGFWNDDSGYHTSFTPSSTELSSAYTASPPLLSPNIVITGHIQVTSNINLRLDSTCTQSPASSCSEEPSPARRAVKRPYDEELDITTASDNTATPTSIIAGKIQKLDVNEVEPSHVDHDLVVCAYPTTPLKKICKSSCKLSPFNRKKFSRKIEFATHSLTCERKCLQPVKSVPKTKVERFKPNPKKDIITQLHYEVELPLLKIFTYLSNEDIYNFSLVSDTWRQAWENVGKLNPRKQRYNQYWNAVSTNIENWEHGTIPKLPDANQIRALREIDNEMRHITHTPGTPRTNKFKKFMKAASLDSRTQLSCVRCQYPSKVMKESSGEEWAKCTNATCSYSFCKLCKSDRHTGTCSSQYDLSEPSPPKRKKNLYSISSKKSKKNLYRLLDQCKRT